MALLDWVGTSEFNSYKAEQKAKIDALQKAIDVVRVDSVSKYSSLQNDIQLKATDSEETAKQAAKNAVDAEGRIKQLEASIREALELIERCKGEAVEGIKKVNEDGSEVKASRDELLAKLEEGRKYHVEIISSKKSADIALAEVQKSVNDIKAVVEESKSLPEEAENIQKLLKEMRDLGDKMKDLLSHSMKRKADIDELHKEIQGYDLKGENDDVEHIDGLRDELKKAYAGISERADALEGRIQGLVENISEKHAKSINEREEEFENLITDSKSRVEAVDGELKALMPGGMAAGLSAAYEKKRDDEAITLEKFETSFKWAICLLVIVSTIPFGVDVYLLGWKSVGIVQVIKDTPSLVASIFPLYLPILWFAHSSNKKVNLSKRLIEEYTHKAVLGKTFSGLSNQIEILPRESAVKDELRTKLLFNLLQVSSENPGKLITNYSKSDHPLMEALESSAKLADSVNTLNNLPGFSAIARRLSKKSKDLVEDEARRVEKGLAAQDIIEGTDQKGSA